MKWKCYIWYKKKEKVTDTYSPILEKISHWPKKDNCSEKKRKKDDKIGDNNGKK